MQLKNTKRIGIIKNKKTPKKTEVIMSPCFVIIGAAQEDIKKGDVCMLEPSVGKIWRCRAEALKK